MSTTTSPAPVTPPPRLGATSHVDEPRRTAEPRWSVHLRWLGDATSIVLLVAVLWWLAYHDGGWERTALAQVGLLALAAVPAAAAELRRLPTVVRVLIAWWAVGLVVSLAFAAERSGFAHPTITYALVPVVGLSAHRLWRRRWGPPAIVALFLVSFGLYWYQAFMGWWGLATWAGREPLWRPLSWHNQSGTLMVAFGLIFAGPALTGRRVIALGSGLCAAAAFAGAWLAGSRGSLIVMLLGAALVVGASLRARDWKRTLLATLSLVLAAAAIATGLLTFASARSPDQVTVTRVTSASGDAAESNFLRRFVHMDAAVGMFVDRPFTGQGLGSYRKMSLPFTPADSNLTASAHNESAEVLGEGGLFLAVPFFGLLLLGASAVWRRLRNSRCGFAALTGDVGVDDVRWPLTVGSAGAVAALMVHQGGDADWAYPILPSLLAVTIALTAHDASQHRRAPSDTRGIPVLAGIVLAALLTAGSVATHWHNRSLAAQPGLSADQLAQVPVAWDSDRAAQVSSTLVRAGEYDHARRTLERGVAWNPGYHPAYVQLAIVEYSAGTIFGEELVDRLLDGYLDFSSANAVAAALIDGEDPQRARSVLRALLELYPAYEGWGVAGSRADTRYLLVRAVLESEGCSAARQEADRARTAASPDQSDTVNAIDQLVGGACT